MRSRFPIIFASSILLLFLIQLAGTLVESIYILDLLNTSLDARVLGLLFFLSPMILLAWRRPASVWLVGTVYLVLLVARGLTPYLDTAGRLLSAGIGTGAALLLLPAIFSARPKGEPYLKTGIDLAAGLALAIGLSVMLRSLEYSLDYSLTSTGGWVGWGLALILGGMLLQLEWKDDPSPVAGKPPTLAICGVFLVITLVYIAFSAPGVIARWTAGSYPAIVLTTSLLAAGWAGFTFYRPAWLSRISMPVVIAWNLLFTLALTVALLVQRVPFPPAPASPPVVVAPPGWLLQVPIWLALFLYPVIFLDLAWFASQIQQGEVALRGFVPGMLLGGLILILLIFTSIFTNVWGYVEPVSPFFRNKFWLPFALIGAGLTLLSLRSGQDMDKGAPGLRGVALWVGVGLSALFFGLAVLGVLSTDRITVQAEPSAVNTLRVMTYNIQQANDGSGEKSYARQLSLIESVKPDVLALQECDSSRIGLNNNDYVRFFASQLGYYSYYGPTTVAGTFGTALLSRYPLENPRTVYAYSDLDEIAITEAEIDVGGRVFTFYNVHPDGSDIAMQVFTQNLLALAYSEANVVILGDFNLREDEAAYQMIASVYTNAWISVYPNGIDSNGLDMSDGKRIDHIFISPGLHAEDPVYLLPPESATDHPAHWAEITWEK